MTWYGVLVPLDLGVHCLSRHVFPELPDPLIPYVISRLSNSPRSMLLREKMDLLYVNPVTFCRQYLDSWMLSDYGLTITPSDDGSSLFIGLEITSLIPSPVTLTEMNCLFERLREVRLNEVDKKIKTLNLPSTPDIYFGDFCVSEDKPRFKLVNASHLLQRLEK